MEEELTTQFAVNKEATKARVSLGKVEVITSRFITGFVTRITRLVPLVEQELLTLPEHLISPPVFSGFVLLDL
jgi:hypothetical protein